jgi:hypothetical protein
MKQRGHEFSERWGLLSRHIGRRRARGSHYDNMDHERRKRRHARRQGGGEGDATAWARGYARTLETTKCPPPTAEPQNKSEGPDNGHTLETRNVSSLDGCHAHREGGTKRGREGREAGRAGSLNSQGRDNAARQRCTRQLRGLLDRLAAPLSTCTTQGSRARTCHTNTQRHTTTAWSNITTLAPPLFQTTLHLSQQITGRK